MAPRDWLLVIFVGSIWGCSFLFNAILIRELDPIWVAAGRVTIAAVASWAILFALRKPLPRDIGLYWKLGVFGIFAYAIPFSLFPLGQAHIPSGLTAIINALTPIMTVIVSHFWPGGEKASVNKSMGVLAGFIGAALLALPAFQTGGTAQLWAIGVCLCATILYAITLNAVRAFKALDPIVLTTLAMSGSAVVSVPTAFITEGIPHVTQPITWAAWVALALFSTVLPFQIVYRLIPRVGATNVASNTFVSPVFAILLGVIILHEAILPIQLLGMLAVFVGLLLIDGRILRRFSKTKAAA